MLGMFGRTRSRCIEKGACEGMAARSYPCRWLLVLLLLTLSLSLFSAHARGRISIDPPTGAQAIDPDDQRFWNSKFSDSHTPFNHEPSRLLVDTIHGLKPGRALDLGMGEGRNAIYLAQQGWEVTGVDLSDVAVAQAKKSAARDGVKLNAVLDGLDHFDLGRDQWDLIILFYMHAWYNDASPRSSQRLQEALKSGGMLVIEGFAGDEKYMFHANQLFRDFGGLKILRYEDTLGDADWAPGRKSHIIRLVAQKAK
jgi:SAM-dependent methyltransferase